MLSHIYEYIVIRHHDGECPEVIVGRTISYLPFIIKLAAMSGTLEKIPGSLQFCSLVSASHPQGGIILFAKTINTNRIFKGIISNNQKRQVSFAPLVCYFLFPYGLRKAIRNDRFCCFKEFILETGGSY